MLRNKMLRNIFCLVVAGLAVSGCGFTPLYATAENGGAPGLRSVSLASFTSSELMRPTLARELERATAPKNAASTHRLFLEVTEGAERLAVQIDASVTRYNYRLSGKYRLIDQKTGRPIAGTVRAIASFNVVNSQYSTLFAENAAREKAARTLVEELERDIMIKLAERRQDEAAGGEAR